MVTNKTDKRIFSKISKKNKNKSEKIDDRRMVPLRKEILYEGYYYDVTDFIKRHPGGEAILEYHTSPGEDATIPFQQFHNRNFIKVTTILKSLKRRPAAAAAADDDDTSSTTTSIVNNNPLSASRNKALTSDYLQLFRELQQEGYFDPSYAHVAYRLGEILVLFLAGLYILHCWNSSSSGWGWGQLLLSSMLLGLAKGRAIFAMHEAGHHSLTGSPGVDRLLSSGLCGLSIGVSAGWWTWNHSQHHAMTNRLDHDLDLDLDPLMAMNEALVKGGRPTIFMRYQKYLIPLNGIVMNAYWKIWHTGTTLLRTRSLSDLLFISLYYIISWNLLTFPTYLISETFVAWYIFGHIGLSHGFMPVRDGPCHWVESALHHSIDIEQGSWWCDWWMGYLNYQVEHHLFPTMPNFRQPQIVERVKALAAKHGIPYHVYGYFEAIRASGKNIMEMEEKMRRL